MATAATAPVEYREMVKDFPCGLLGRQKLRALDGVTLRIEPGEVFGLLGPNRAGKTTLVKLLLSLCSATSGEVMRLGSPAADRRTLARVGYVHENQAFPRYLSATALLEFYGALSLLPEQEVKARVPQLLELVGLADRGQEPISRFSKGMVQRLGIAQALINDPELLVFDEPSEGLDLMGRQTVRAIIAEYRRRGRTVLFISHVLSEVEQVCDRIGILVSGKLVYLGTLENFKKTTEGSQRTLEEALQAVYGQSNLSEPGASATG
jgi:ABC-2 type transport system ATP-binding protein